MKIKLVESVRVMKTTLKEVFIFEICERKGCTAP